MDRMQKPRNAWVHRDGSQGQEALGADQGRHLRTYRRALAVRVRRPPGARIMEVFEGASRCDLPLPPTGREGGAGAATNAEQLLPLTLTLSPCEELGEGICVSFQFRIEQRAKNPRVEGEDGRG